jgi:hypothetical protein
MQQQREGTVMDRDGLVRTVSARQADATWAAMLSALELALEFQRWATAAAVEQTAARAAVPVFAKAA